MGILLNDQKESDKKRFVRKYYDLLEFQSKNNEKDDGAKIVTELFTDNPNSKNNRKNNGYTSKRAVFAELFNRRVLDL